MRYTFSVDEVSALIALAASMDESEFPHPLAKSIIFKCKSAVADADNGPVRFNIVK